MLPRPNLGLGNSWAAGPKGNLDLFLNLQAAHVPSPSSVIKRGQGSFVSSPGDNITCTNSRNSAAGTGDYDTISFTGFGTWSKDAAFSLPRFASVSLSLAADAPYTGILVFQNPDATTNVIMSSGNNKPPVTIKP